MRTVSSVPLWIRSAGVVSRVCVSADIGTGKDTSITEPLELNASTPCQNEQNVRLRVSFI